MAEPASGAETPVSAWPLLRVLGECRVEPPTGARDGSSIAPAQLPTLTQRRILARLALDAPRVVSVEELAAAVWEETHPAKARQALQNQISRLRAVWGESIVRTAPAGYALRIPTDAQLLVGLASTAEEVLGTGAAAEAFGHADAALALWQGDPFEEIGHLPGVTAIRGTLDAARRGAEDLRLEAGIALGRVVWATSEAERLAAQDPLDERRQALRVRALLLAGQRGRSLAAATTARLLLRNELGVEPGHWLAAAEAEALGAVSAAPHGTDSIPDSALSSLGPAEAISAAREVAAAANSSGEHQEAVRWITRALEVAGADARTRLMLRIELGDAQRLAGDPAHLGTLLDAAREALDAGQEDTIAAACFALLQLGATSTSGNQIPEVRAVIDRALPRITNPELRAPVLAAASLARSLVGLAARSRDLFIEALDTPVSEETRSRVLRFSYMALGSPGDLELRRAAAQELTVLAERRGDPVDMFEAAQLRYSVALQDGDGEAARSAVDAMGQTIGRVGDTGRRWSLLFCRAAIAHLDGDDQKCEWLAAQAQQLFAPVSPARAAAAHAGQLIALRTTQGRLHTLAPLLTAFASEQPGIPAFHAAAALALAETDPESAHRHAELALDLAQDDATWLAGHATGGRAATVVGDRLLCERYLERLLPWTGRGIWQGTCSFGPVDTTLALLLRSLSRDTEARAHAKRAQTIAASLQAKPFLTELTRYGLA
jgi:DNA-binding SARP family transcriptional activator